MASIILGCLGFALPKIRERRRQKKAAQREYADQFDELREQNEKRVKQISSTAITTCKCGAPAGHRGPCMFARKAKSPPPAYETVVQSNPVEPGTTVGGRDQGGQNIGAGDVLHDARGTTQGSRPGVG